MIPSPIEKWRKSLQGWGVPQEIVNQAPQSPWIHPPASFKPDGDLFPNSPSWLRAKQALAGAGNSPTVLDIGCGGGRASLGLAPPAVHITGVDQQQSMLDLFASEADSRSISVTTISGNWPEVASQTPICDVVVCHHVLFNVPELQDFAQQLKTHAHRRVVIEIPMNHPLASLSPAWKYFWQIERPVSPTALDAADVLRELGVDLNVETFTAPDHKTTVTDVDVEHTRVRLCLNKSRDAEVREFLENRDRSPRTFATIWWDSPNHLE